MATSIWVIRERQFERYNRDNWFVCSRRGRVNPGECYECWENMDYSEQNRYGHNRQACRENHEVEERHGAQADD
jgi:hypothetical protein